MPNTLDLFKLYPANKDKLSGFSREKITGVGEYMSYSRVKLLAKSAADYEWIYIKDNKDPDTPEKQRGRFLHRALLEPADFKKSYILKPNKEDPNMIVTLEDLKEHCLREGWDIPKAKTKKDFISMILAEYPEVADQIYDIAIEQAKKASKEDGKMLITHSEFDMVVSQLDLISQDPKCVGALRGGYSEVFAYWYDPEFEWTWMCVLDRLNIYENKNGEKWAFITELKTTRDASPRGFEKEKKTYGYHIQNFIYERVVRGITGLPTTMANIAVENVNPIGIGKYFPSPREKEAAKYLVALAKRRYDHGKVTGKWPKYDEKFIELGLPNYAYWEIEEMAERELNEEGVNNG